eukprot:5095301-Amphidinium_carterae.1
MLQQHCLVPCLARHCGAAPVQAPVWLIAFTQREAQQSECQAASTEHKFQQQLLSILVRDTEEIT